MFITRAAILFAVLCIALPGLVAQELSASLDSAHTAIGSATHLRLKFAAPNHQLTPRSSAEELRAMPELEILEQTPFQKTADGWEQSFRIIAFQAGEYALPVPVVDWGDSLYRAVPLRWVVTAPALPADEALAPIKDIIEEPRNLSDYLLPVFIAAAAILLSLLLWHLWRRRKKEPVLPPEPELPPYVQAQKLLEELQQSGLWRSDHKQFYIRLSDIVRLYISRQYRLPALTETTDLILQKMKPLCADKAIFDALREILQTSDLVKFAKARPDDAASERLLEAAFVLVSKTEVP